MLDVRMPDGNGIEVCREIRSSFGTPCLILTSYSDDEALFEAIMAGASGYVQVSNLLAKLGMEGRTQAAVYAARLEMTGQEIDPETG